MRGFAFTKFLILWLSIGIAASACDRARNSSPTTNANPPASPSMPDLSSSLECRTVAHVAGATEVCGQPERIVVLGPYVLEPLLALGVQPVAFADHIQFHQGDYDNPSQQIFYLGSRIDQPIANVGIAYNPSIEAMLKVQPDLILGMESSAKDYGRFSEIAPTILINWSEPEESLKTIAQAVDRTEQAEQLLMEMKQRIATNRQDFAPVVAKYPQVLLMSSAQLQEIYLGRNTFGLCSSMIEELGFQLVLPTDFTEPLSGSPLPMSIEVLPQLNNADLVILLGNNFNDIDQIEGMSNFEASQLKGLKQAWAENSIAQSLDASKAGRVYFIPAYLCLGLPGAIGSELYLNELKQQILSSK
jgi:iron complex transport system substrate-binding protein